MVLVNPWAAETQTVTLRHHDFSSTDGTCETSVQVPALGQVVVDAGVALACSTENRGLVEISGQGEFAGIAVVSQREDGTMFSVPFFERPAGRYPLLEHWTVAVGTVTYGANSSAGCVAVANTAIDGEAHTVHTSKWQKRAHGSSSWTDIAGTSRTGMVCAYTPSVSEPGQYRGVAEISVDGERGMYASGLLTISTSPGTTDNQPSFGSASVSNQTYTAGNAISPLMLPLAVSGDGPLTYSLSPSLPGLSFDPSTRVLSGAPEAAGTYNMTYGVRDADGDVAVLNFTVAVVASQTTTTDLVVASVSVSASSPGAGRPFDLRATVTNAGTGMSVATTLRLYRSEDSTISPGDTHVGSAAVGALPGDGSSSEAIRLTAPQVAGTYYYGGCVVPVPGEYDAGNNCSSAVLVTVTDVQAEIESFSLDSNIRDPVGITFAGGQALRR